jgi:cyclopropane-fatty-acyl-phospholipid synthase
LDFTLIFNPALSVPEAYMAGQLTIEDGTLYDFMAIVARNYKRLEQSLLFRIIKLFDIAKFGQYNPIKRSRKNVAHYYDLADDLYNLFLDPDRQYSCAYYPDEDTDLETAQLEKKRHLAAKLLIKLGQKILEIGFGWGGLGLYLSKTENVDVTGVTLSVEQLKVSSDRADKAGLSDRVRFRLIALGFAYRTIGMKQRLMIVSFQSVCSNMLAK